MSDLVTAAPSLLAPLTDPAGGPALTRLRSFAGQPPVRRMLPWFLGLSALGGAALAWDSFAPGNQRTLYSELSDSERASVVAALDKAAITYRIDNQTGALTVAEDDFYRARMLAAADGALASPDGGSGGLEALPMGASRTMEAQHLRASREHELVLTIMQIDGVEAVRVHLAEGEKSVFVRENAAPSASVMVRLARGRQMGDSQVAAIVNLVAASVPGMTPDAVRVVDQHGRLLTDRKSTEGDRLDLQARMEEKLRAQVAQLLTPMLGEGNFTTEVQADLDMDQVTSARESFDKAGVVRSETQQQSSTSDPPQAGGVPGVMSNTPPPAAVAKAGPPLGGPPTPAPAAPVSGEASTTRNYELGREVAVANTSPGKLKRLSVAVAISAKAVKTTKADIDQIKQLVSAAAGIDPARGDQVAIVARNFTTAEEMAGLPFYETSWFASLLRNGVALLAVLLVLLLGVRPLIKVLRREPGAVAAAGETVAGPGQQALPAPSANRPIDPARLSQQVGLAQQLIAEQPETAVAALRQMLSPVDAGAAA
jgi:flagellar M-ring protein FliF